MGAITTIDKLAAYLPQVDFTLAENEQLTKDILDRATSIVEGAVGVSYALTAPIVPTTVSVWSAAGSPFLHLPPHVSGSVTAVVDPYGNTVESTAYEEQYDGLLLVAKGAGTSIYYRNFLPYPGYGFQPGRYLVTALFGPQVAPLSIEQVTLEVAVNLWRSRDKGSWTDVIGVDGSGGIRFLGGLTNSQRAIVEAERARLFPLQVA